MVGRGRRGEGGKGSREELRGRSSRGSSPKCSSGRTTSVLGRRLPLVGGSLVGCHPRLLEYRNIPVFANFGYVLMAGFIRTYRLFYVLVNNHH